MSALKEFLKGNKRKRENTTYKASKCFQDEKGNVLDWIIKPLTTEENDRLREECTISVPVKGKKGMYSPKVDTSKYLAKLIAASVVEPNLNDKELQDSYGVMSAEALIKEMIDSPGEYNAFVEFIQEFNDFDVTIDEEVEEAKN